MGTLSDARMKLGSPGLNLKCAYHKILRGNPTPAVVASKRAAAETSLQVAATESDCKSRKSQVRRIGKAW